MRTGNVDFQIEEQTKAECARLVAPLVGGAEGRERSYERENIP